jgi:MYXO-CTERM domain-containing protein
LALLVMLAYAGPPLQVPWTCGVTKPCTQAHGGFSHTGDSQWAWDFDVNEGEEVWAASTGIVSYIRMDSTTGGCDASYGSDANYVIVDHDDGTSVVYMHLQANSSPLAVGDAVRPGMLVARVGLTGYVCGDHLHLQVQEQCGSYYCQSLQASFADYGDPAEGDQIESTNCPACELSLDGGVTLVSELEPGCFVRETTSWWSAMNGDDDHHFYTFANDGAEPQSIGTWRFGVTVPGDYRVEVFVPDADADSTGAVYRVDHSGASEMFPIDQSTAKGWQELGVFAFSGVDGEGIVLGDNTGEATAMQKKIGYDAVRLTFVPSGGESGSDGGDTTGGSEGGSASASGSGNGSASTTASDESGGTSGAIGDDDALPDTFGETDEHGGCDCNTGRDASTGALALLLLLSRRRRRDVLRMQA